MKDDPFNLSRFVSTQESIYETVLAELRRGAKRSHWIWFIFPQIAGLGSSSTSRHFAIKNLDEAKAYLQHPVLGKRLRECCEILLSLQGLSASEIFGYPDDLKLRSSMTLFDQAAGEEKSFFAQILAKYYGGERDSTTLQLLTES